MILLPVYVIILRCLLLCTKKNVTVTLERNHTNQVGAACTLV